MALAPPGDPRRAWQLALRCGWLAAIVLAMPAVCVLLVAVTEVPRVSMPDLAGLTVLWIPALLYGGFNIYLWQCRIWALTALIALNVMHMGVALLVLAAVVGWGAWEMPGYLISIVVATAWLAGLAQYVGYLHRSYDVLQRMAQTEPRGFEPILRTPEAGARSGTPDAQQPAAETPGSGRAGD